MRLLAVDFGEARLGLAASDEAGRMVVPVGAIRRTSDAQAAREVIAAAREREVVAIVVGLPRSEDGSEGASARRARNFGRRLGEESGLPVHFQDEALTTVEAESSLRETGLSAEKRKGARDAEAAAVILRDHLAARARSEA